jgi:hypothetical protein
MLIQDQLSPLRDHAGENFYVGGGVDDNVHQYTLTGGTWQETGAPISLKHNRISNALFPNDIGALTSGIDITQDGSKLVVANLENDSISFIDLTTRAVVEELDLRPGKIDPANSGVPGGEYPFWVTVKGSNTVYVSSSRDREIVVVDFTTVSAPKVLTRIEVAGNPNKMILDKAQKYLYVSEDNSDLVDIIDTSAQELFQSVLASAPDEFKFDKPLSYAGSAPTLLILISGVSTRPSPISGVRKNGNANSMLTSRKAISRRS